jgi:glycosyltransferase involved in cell wall biosynthesis
VILSVAHLYRRKDIATLLEAAARMKTPARLRIVGDGPERGRLARLCRRRGLDSRVTFRGHVPFAELAAEYRSAGIFCLPSRQEGFGIVLLEAMAAGLAVVAARAGAVPEIVMDGKTGVLVPPGDPETLAEALDGLLRDAALRKRLGEAGERRAASYDAPLVARLFLDAIGLTPVPAAQSGTTWP